MCGINGITWKDEELILRMNEAIKHRGPDGTDHFLDDRISLGHNLLAITETPVNSGQPVVSPDRQYVMLYNGEIYNYRALRDKLRLAGDVFQTDSDTEVLFAGLRRYGADFLEQLDGMFAIAWYDVRAGTILLARDTGGIKPLYWTVDSRGLAFSSEFRGLFAAGIGRNFDTQAGDLYLALGYVPGPMTLVRGVRKVCPGQHLTYRLNGGSIQTGWFGAWRQKELPALEEDLHGQIRHTIGTSARAHTMGLRPFGLYLSGGLDSSIILHELAADHGRAFKTYTTRFAVPDSMAADFNEDADIARRLCSDYGVEHQELEIDDRSYADAYEAAIMAIEEPRWNAGIGAYWLLARQAARESTVILNGSGGDELFLGYPKYIQSRHIQERYSRYPRALVDLWYSTVGWYKGRLDTGTILHVGNILERWAYLNRIGSRDHTKLIAGVLRMVGYPAVEHPLADGENALAELDRLFWLADEEYIRTDKISMHFGMEGRFPLMGCEVVRLASAIPSSTKLQGSTTKHLLRQAYRGHVPDYVVDKRKTGWKVPVGHWMLGDFGRRIKEVLSAGYYDGLHGFIDPESVRARHVDGKQGFQTQGMKNFLPTAALQIWARQLDITL